MRFIIENRKMGDTRLSRRGFTLVELLVVMAIIAMLSTLAVGGYLTYRKSALLNLTADNLVSQINAMRSKTIYGSGNTQKFEEIKADLAKPATVANSGAEVKLAVVSNPKCEGVYFHTASSGSFVAESFEQDFNNQKHWNGTAWIYDACGDFDPTKVGLAFEFDREVSILHISDDTGPLHSLVMRFVPTNGDLEIRENENQKFISDFTQNDAPKMIKIKIQYGANLDPNYQRIISFDLLTGKTTVSKVTDSILN